MTYNLKNLSKLTNQINKDFRKNSRSIIKNIQAEMIGKASQIMSDVGASDITSNNKSIGYGGVAQISAQFESGVDEEQLNDSIDASLNTMSDWGSMRKPE